jgi:hypothetical protein
MSNNINTFSNQPQRLNGNLNGGVSILVETPLIIKKGLLKELLKFHPDFKVEANSEKASTSIGVNMEKNVFSILQLLEAEEVSLTPEKIENGYQYYSIMDVTLKGDIYLTVGDKVLIFQIKTFLQHALKHKSLEKVTFNSLTYPVPGLIYVNPEKIKFGWKLHVLKEVSRITGVPVKDEVLLALEKYELFKGKKLKEVPIKGIFSTQESVSLTTLGLIQVKGSKIIL